MFYVHKKIPLTLAVVLPSLQSASFSNQNINRYIVCMFLMCTFQHCWCSPHFPPTRTCKGSTQAEPVKISFSSNRPTSKMNGQRKRPSRASVAWLRPCWTWVSLIIFPRWDRHRAVRFHVHRIFQDIHQQAGSQFNIVLSPLSIWTILAMLLEGAGGKTELELKEKLNATGRGPEDARSYIRSRYRELHRLTKGENDYFHILGNLWLTQTSVCNLLQTRVVQRNSNLWIMSFRTRSCIRNFRKR